MIPALRKLRQGDRELRSSWAAEQDLVSKTVFHNQLQLDTSLGVSSCYPL